MSRTTTRTVITDEYVPYTTTTVTRERIAPMIPERYDEIGYGSSYPDWMRY